SASESFGTYLGFGLTCLIGFQAIVNIFVAMGLLPTKGLTLPFISYGGTSLIVMMGAAGILLSLSVRFEKMVAAPERGPSKRRQASIASLGASRVRIAGEGQG